MDLLGGSSSGSDSESGEEVLNRELLLIYETLERFNVRTENRVVICQSEVNAFSSLVNFACHLIETKSIKILNTTYLPYWNTFFCYRNDSKEKSKICDSQFFGRINFARIA